MLKDPKSIQQHRAPYVGACDPLLLFSVPSARNGSRTPNEQILGFSNNRTHSFKIRLFLSTVTCEENGVASTE